MLDQLLEETMQCTILKIRGYLLREKIIRHVYHILMPILSVHDYVILAILDERA